ncbi:MAG: hypothetical protein A2504_15900 [Bdellovibrionales bacterium RIFOXYD12_FULL_39_22]|nr:MAG: hypothetical protein A2385_07810 [Bdellovibrionales bacterium RIFOXYB1_FULL_39_21]OFZ43035.1 MAG: hypothetical protein A2485_11415 [Bdellovibrionales bacterium RIFOXYC12_FULL_39_17]OFZ50879.1 MAG: hypothetical protein A2404_06725 [Bdellovibrionales bacterium RIFOXYC1_FULL_39_130]OFZ78102.1 MAG: hypothetical protein A2560_01895 [Bdellovibrionales bacterium RIFOXYD1_FULL_39_84]OFZ93970.1 MAG: hypothetical protein A2504_15900 [Bdellovibrionales bacterium RIFOXYD12_FULL_39_22]HLE10419.1 hy
MKSLLSFLILIMMNYAVDAAEYDDRNCNIFVVSAGNIITGSSGNFLSATIAVSKDLIAKHYKNYQVKIVGNETSTPDDIVDVGNFLLFFFDKYTEGIEYHGNSANIKTYITNGIDHLFDNNDNVWLVREHNWQYTNQHCEYN